MRERFDALEKFGILEKFEILWRQWKTSVTVGCRRRFWSRFCNWCPSHHLYAQRGRLFGVLKSYEVNTVYTGYKSNMYHKSIEKLPDSSFVESLLSLRPSASFLIMMSSLSCGTDISSMSERMSAMSSLSSSSSVSSSYLLPSSIRSSSAFSCKISNHFTWNHLASWCDLYGKEFNLLG